MKEVNLFLSKKGQWVTNFSLMENLREIEADKCDLLYIHSSLNFGVPNPNIKKKELLNELLQVILSLGVKTICMPTFTFSFCNKQTYDPLRTPSKMCVLNEYFRKQEGVIRSIDPLMSVALFGEDKDLVNEIGKYSCGACSTFDKIRHRSSTKFLFLGPKIGDCMTYMHYLEWLYSVDYRYERLFRGKIIMNGNETTDEYYLFVRYNSVVPNDASYTYEQIMYDKGVAKKITCGDGSISIVGEKEASKEYLNCLQENPYYFVDFKNDLFIKDKSFLLEREMIAL